MMRQQFKVTRLQVAEVELTIDVSRFGFETTEDLEPLQEILGQPRALRALDLGLGVRHPSFNIYVAGMSGMAKKSMIFRALTERVGEQPRPPDWVYVNNFDEPDKPRAISLPPGDGARLKRDMEALVDRLRDDLPKLFQHEELSRQKQRIAAEYHERAQKMANDLERLAEEKGLAARPLPDDEIMLVPARNGKPIPDDELEQLSEQEKEDIRRRQREVAEQASGVFSRQRDIQRDLRDSIKNLERNLAEELIQPAVDDLSVRFESAAVRDWLANVKEHMLEHLERFRKRNGPPAEIAKILGQPSPEQAFRDYRVNVLVDNSTVQGAPVVVEEAPNYKNLFGIIDRTIDPMGRGSADFLGIKAGSLLRAAGGFLVFNLMDALMEPVVWKELKRTIKRGSLQIEEYEPLGLFSISPLKPEAIPLNVKLVAIGTPLAYHLLYLYDEDFKEIFKVKAEFDPEMEWPEQAGLLIGKFISRLRHEDGHVLPFTAEGVAELLYAGSRLVEDRRKLTTELNRLADLVREASFWASRSGKQHVERDDVIRAVDEKLFRSDLIASKIREMIADGSLRVSLRGLAIGQVNGISLINLGDASFGRPVRLTASVGVGAGGIINIERESKLSGRTFDKGMLILEGYLRNKYADEHPLTLSASIAMEQSYGTVEGDSASVAELVSLLSSLADVPLRQDIAVTGSVNQWGQVQAVGGVNEKIEGFFDVCRERGLSGEQGVIIPAANAKNLVLRPDVLNAVRQEQFSVWAVDHADDALTILTEMEAGEVSVADSLHGRVYIRLLELARLAREQRAWPEDHVRNLQPEPAPSRDPRPPLPGNHD